MAAARSGEAPEPTGGAARTVGGGKPQPGMVLGEGWTMGGGPDAHGTRPLGNWQSDRAWDLMAPAGTPVYAPANSVIVKTRFADNGKTVWGYQVTLAGSGDTFFLTHLGRLAKGVKAGGRVKRGQLIGWLGQPPYFASHLHIGIERGDLADYMEGV